MKRGRRCSSSKRPMAWGPHPYRSPSGGISPRSGLSGAARGVSVRAPLDRSGRARPAPFDAAALIWTGRRLVPLADPRRHPGALLRDLTSPVFGVTDKMRLARLALHAGARPGGRPARRPPRRRTSRRRRRCGAPAVRRHSSSGSPGRFGAALRSIRRWKRARGRCGSR